MSESGLKKEVGLIALIIYGVGDILGAGIYALIGKVAGLAGEYVWASFLIALIVATLTALSYAELGSRFPKAGGVAHFSHQAFKSHWTSVMVGWLMLATCFVSMATLSKAFAGYLQSFLPALPEWIIIFGLYIAIAFVVFRGIKEATVLNMVCTALEVTGLFIVIIVAALFVFRENAEAARGAVEASSFSWTHLFQGAALAFYAFIGFEDMVNISEETQNPSRTIPIAILCSLAIAGVIYIAVALLATKVLTPDQLLNSKAPLVDVVAAARPSFPTIIFTAIALFAVLNTALLNYVTASRLMYGMAEEKLFPRFLAQIHPARRTPHWAIALILPVVVVLALSGSLQFLAGGTATLIMIVFIVVNLSLLVVKRKKIGDTHFQIWAAVPIVALVSNITLIAFAASTSHQLALTVVAIGFILLGIQKFSKKF